MFYPFLLKWLARMIPNPPPRFNAKKCNKFSKSYCHHLASIFFCVLVAVMKIEEVVGSRNSLHPQRPRGDGLRRVPADKEVDVVAVRGIQARLRHHRAAAGDCGAASERCACMKHRNAMRCALRVATLFRNMLHRPLLLIMHLDSNQSDSTKTSPACQWLFP